ncbi:DUF1766-domain-containing protein [Metarhizium brunneum]
MSLQEGTSLHPVSSKDIPTLVDIHYEAFADDALMKLMYGSHGDAASTVSDLREALEDPTARFTKAVDNETGDIVGWSWWNVYLDAETHLEAAKATEEEQKEAPETAISPKTFLQYHAAVNDKRRRWITGKPGILQAIAVRPKSQGRGVGTALVRAGLEEAKRNGVLAWLEASSAGHGLYEKCGFRDVGEAIESDLGAYGKVTTVCMMYEP